MPVKCIIDNLNVLKGTVHYDRVSKYFNIPDGKMDIVDTLVSLYLRRVQSLSKSTALIFEEPI